MIVNSAATLKPRAGNEDFTDFINGHYYYVDKTQYLKEIFSDSSDRLLTQTSQFKMLAKHC